MSDNPALTQEMKDWFGQGEYDTDLMISWGLISSQQIIEMYNREVLGQESGY